MYKRILVCIDGSPASSQALATAMRIASLRGRKGVQRALLGSGAEQIVRMGPVPVLVVRAPPDIARLP